MPTVTDKHREMVLTLAKPGNQIQASLDPIKCDLWHHATGAMTEATELLAHTDVENLREECGDLEFYLRGISENFGLGRGKRNAIHTNGSDDIIRALVIHVGELLDATKKVVIYEQEPDVRRFANEFATIDSLLEALYARHGFDRDDALNANMAKLAKRYPGFQFTNERAEARADKA